MSKKNMLKESKRGIKNKSGQITIFIIIAILIVMIILIYFLWVKPRYVDSGTGRLNFEICMEGVVNEKISELGLNGGFAKPEFSYPYNGEKIGYLCYTNLYLRPCIVQVPLIKQHFEEQLQLASKEGIVDCYKTAVDELNRKGYNIVSGTPDLKISLDPGKVNINLDLPTAVSGRSTSSYKNFKTEINSRIYEMLMIATSIVQYETRYGDSDITGLMIYNPDFIIDKLKRGDETKIYTIEDKTTKTKLQFASRSYAWPAGYGIDSGLVRSQ